MTPRLLCRWNDEGIEVMACNDHQVSLTTDSPNLRHEKEAPKAPTMMCSGQSDTRFEGKWKVGEMKLRDGVFTAHTRLRFGGCVGAGLDKSLGVVLCGNLRPAGAHRYRY